VGDRDHELDRDLLQELLSAYGPCGQEDAVRDLCRRELEPLVDATWVDPAGNLVALIRGGDAPSVRVMAHMDELSMLVKRVESDGSLHVTQLGTMYPGNFGLGPVAVLGDEEMLCGVLTLGSEHTTKRANGSGRPSPTRAIGRWTGPTSMFSPAAPPRNLAARASVPAPASACTAASGHWWSSATTSAATSWTTCAAITALVQAARRLSQRDGRPAGDVYFAFTTNEEIGGVGGSYASRTLPGDLTLAVEVGPTEPEYNTTCSGGPIIAYSDARCVYDKDVADALMAIATQRGLSPQAAVLGAFESDASHSKASGLSPRAGLLCLPTLSTHGYEVITRDAVAAVTDVLTGFLRRGSLRSHLVGEGRPDALPRTSLPTKCGRRSRARSLARMDIPSRVLPRTRGPGRAGLAPRLDVLGAV